MKQATPKLSSSDPISERTLANLAGASGLWAEMQSLLDHEIANLSTPAMRQLVVEANVLAKRTLDNRKRVWKKLTERYSLQKENPVFASFLRLYYDETSAAQRGLLGYLLLCANDPLVRRLSAGWLAPRLARSGAALKTEDVLSQLAALSREIPAVSQWTEATRLHVSQHYLGAIRDFGLAEGRVSKRTVRPYVGNRVLIYAIHLGMIQGLKPLEILQSVWFRLLGIDLDMGITRLYQLNAEGSARFRMIGNVVELALVESEIAW